MFNTIKPFIIWKFYTNYKWYWRLFNLHEEYLQLSTHINKLYNLSFLFYNNNQVKLSYRN